MLYKAGAGFRLQSGQEWVYSLFAGQWDRLFQGVPRSFEMLIVNGAPLYLLAAFLEWDGEQPVPFYFCPGRKPKEAAEWNSVGPHRFSRCPICASLVCCGAFGIFFFGYADEITAWKMLLYAVIMKFLDTMGRVSCHDVCLCRFKTGYNRFSGAGCWKSALCCAQTMGILSALRPFRPDTDCGIKFRCRAPAAAALGTEAIVIMLTLGWLLTFGSKKNIGLRRNRYELIY